MTVRLLAVVGAATVAAIVALAALVALSARDAWADDDPAYLHTGI